MECHQQKRGTSKGMAGFHVVVRYKMVYCNYSLDNLHIKAVNYNLILLGTIPQVFIEKILSSVNSKY